MRALRTAFTERWQDRRDEVRSDPRAVLAELQAAEEAGVLDELIVVGGQSAGLVGDVLPVAKIVETIAAEAAAILAWARELVD
jgi:NAD(P)H-dependent flavin oxidoreductase YrpB (nitropropane dioxygenase family)